MWVNPGWLVFHTEKWDPFKGVYGLLTGLLVFCVAVNCVDSGVTKRISSASSVWLIVAYAAPRLQQTLKLLHLEC